MTFSIYARAAFACLMIAATSFADEPKIAPSPVPAPDAPGRMKMPEGFTSTLFAAEPDVKQPIAFTIDPKGRLWVVECYSYPVWLGGPQGKDRILIFEDTDGDGRHDKKTVFYDKGSNFTGIALGFGGVWVCATPNLLFIPDRDGNDIPDGEPVVKLDGWDVKAQHNMFNALNWGPDGFLWGCNGIMSNSRVGKPGTPDDQRVAINCGVWKYHPTRERFEVVSTGTTNPWGLDFDEYGEAFITNCVIPHLFQAVPGSRHQRMFGQDFGTHSYELMETTADHLHWAGGHWTDSRDGKGAHGEAGGGHAHAGAMIYLGDNWPDTYRNSLFTANIHGHRINHDTLERSGSGYVAKHAKDFLLANDDWFRGLELKYGPDGAVYMTDWSDMGECHETDADNAHRENGRIYKITFGTPKPVKVDLAKMSDLELVGLQTHHNDWYVRTSRRLLQERAAGGSEMQAVHRALKQMYAETLAIPVKLRAIWALSVTGGLDATFMTSLLGNESDIIRAWGIRLLGEPSGEILAQFASLAKNDPSSRVRLSLASTLQKLPVEQRWEIAKGLISHSEDATDVNLALMDWYGIEPLVPLDRAKAVALATEAKIPKIRRYLARRTVLADESAADASSKPGLSALASALEKSPDPLVRQDLLDGVLDAYRGRKNVEPPAGWSTVAAALLKDADPAVRLKTLLLSLVYSDAKAGEQLAGFMSDSAVPAPIRETALQALVEARVPGLPPRILALLDDNDLRRPALRALSAFQDSAIPTALIKRYASLHADEREDAITALASRPSYAEALLDAVGEGVIAPREINATIARQIQALNQPKITELLAKVWGSSRPTSKDKVAMMLKYKSVLNPASMKTADASRGRSVFNRNCMSCHKLFDQGGNVGPELTGSDRANFDYILENVLDPSATVGRDFRLVIVSTTDGRLITGIMRDNGEKTITVQTSNERIVIPRDEIDGFKESSESMMPEGLLEKLSEDEIRDLLAYLSSKAQIPPSDAEKSR